MSYPSLPGFYASGLASQTNQNYNPGREIVRDPSHGLNQGRYPDEHHHIQYGSSTNTWDHAPQNIMHATKSNAYRDDNWQHRHTAPFHYDTHPNTYPVDKADARTAPTVPTRYNDPNGRNSHGLNHLAYASGLEPSQSPVQQQQTAHNAVSLNSGSLTSVSVQRYGASSAPPTHTQMSHAMRQQRSDSSSSSRQMAIDAATALAAAGRNRYPPPQAQNDTAQSGPGISTILNNTHGQPRVKTPSQHPRSPRVASSAGIPPFHDSNRTQDQLTRSNIINHSQSSRPVPDPNTRGLRPPSSLNRDAIDLDVRETSGEPQHQGLPTGEDLVQPSHYVNPMQVFNPYHREHEQKRKEAEEAMMKQKTDEAQQLQKSSDGKRKAEKARPRGQGKASGKSDLTKNPSDLATAPGKDNLKDSEKEQMATELQSIMEKVKMFRSKDPSLFQKLWSEMRGKESSSSGGQLLSAVTALSTATSEKPLVLPSVSPALPATSSPANSTKKASRASSGPPANGYRIVVEDNSEGLPDLGRFPAERRIRNAYKASEAASKLESTPAVQSNGQHMQPVNPVNTSDTKWPEPRRRAVAIAGLRILKADPENKEVSISAQDFYTILEKNPSYLDLCAALESKGLKFKRNVFARDLLRSVPDLHSDQVSGPHGAASVEITGIIATSAIDKPPSQPLAGASMNADEAPIKNGTQNSTPNLLGGMKVIQYQPQPRHPLSGAIMGSKEAAARKRDFADIVDLTALGDNEDYVMPDLKKAKLDGAHQLASHHKTENMAVTKSPSAEFSGFPNTQRLNTAPLRFTPQVTVSEVVPHSIPAAFNVRGPGGQSHPEAPPRRMILAQKIDHVGAFQKTFYDPRTVARDILIASGRHSTQQPLNSHLGGLQPTYIDADSDLSTFDWDAIDPGGPPLPKTEYADVIAIPPRRSKLGVRKSPHRRAQVNANQAPSQASTTDPLSLSRPPSPQHLRGEAQAQAQAQGKLQSQNSTDGRSSIAEKPASDPQSGSAHASVRTQSKIRIDVPDLVSERRSQSAAQSVIATATKPNMDFGRGSFKRRGRPPGSKNKASSSSHVHRPSANLPALEHQDQDIPPPPAMPNYKCKWARCSSVLHNLDTLRKHVAIRHPPTQIERQDFGFICWWKRCKHLHMNSDKTIEADHAFDTEEEWMAHIEAEHIQPIALKLGDGPNTNTNPLAMVQARDRFLSDEQGRATTPAVNLDGSPNLPHDVLELVRQPPNTRDESRSTTETAQKAFEKAQRAFMKAHGAKHEDHRRQAEETVRAMAARKLKTGPGIDRGGCTLINEARRATFVQAPGIARIIDAPY